jgi:hypothetical protein
VTVLDDSGAVVTGSTAVWTLGTLGAHTADERLACRSTLANDARARRARVLSTGRPLPERLW